MSALFCSGFGRYHTANPTSKNPKAYITATYKDIVTLAENPPSVPKDKAQWILPSTMLSREKAEQMAGGEFHFLVVDLDKNAPALDEINHAIQSSMGDIFTLYYASKSATKDNPKCHVLIPVAIPLTGYKWTLCQAILNDIFESFGIQPDRKTEDVNQLIYLPNRGEYYAFQITRGHVFNPAQAWYATLHTRHEQAEGKKQASERASTNPPPTTNNSLIDRFNSTYVADEFLLLAGYLQKGTNFKHPQSETGNYSASVKNGKTHTLSSSDPLYLQNGGAHSCFGVFTILMHDGDISAALVDAGDNYLEVGGVSFNKHQHLEWIKNRWSS